MNDIGYDGYFGYELCHQLPVVDGQTVDIEFAHQNAQLAAEFMREMIEAETLVARDVSSGAAASAERPRSLLR